MTAEDIASQNLQNLAATVPEAYAVRYSALAARDFPAREEDRREDGVLENVWEQAFPFLFPYGEGGLERNRPVPLSLADHVRWALQYHDGRF